MIYGNISDIRALGNVKFEKLEILNLGGNQISNIDVLEKINFKELNFLSSSNLELRIDIEKYLFISIS